MSATFSMPDDTVTAMLADVLGRYHPQLHDAGVRVGVLMASEVKHGGYPAAATISVVALKDRVRKKIDVEMIVSLWWWEKSRDRHRVALLDHELRHLQLVREPQSGIISRDDLGRPRLKTVKGDWNVGDAFADVIARHGEWAVEFLNIRRAKALADAAVKGEVPDGETAEDESPEEAE